MLSKFFSFGYIFFKPTINNLLNKIKTHTTNKSKELFQTTC